MDNEEDESSAPVVQCFVTIEYLASSGVVTKQEKLKDAALRIVRNEFRELLLRITSPRKNLKLPLKGTTFYRRFVKQGKASVRFPSHGVLVMISNAPPSQLAVFLQTMAIKLVSQQTQVPAVSVRQKLLSAKEKSLTDISPITEKDVNCINGKRKASDDSSKQVLKSIPVNCLQTTPVRKKGCIKPVRTKDAILQALNPTPLTAEQKTVLQAVLSGRNIFFTGSAGTGKSLLLRHILSALPPDSTVATASTGAAACLIGGITLHSFAGVGKGHGSFEHCIELATRRSVQQMWRRCKHLVVDEISMVDGDFFERVERVARVVRSNERPFGGIQVILCGDFLQLPPVSTGQRRFCFQADAWERCGFSNYELTVVKRQDDPEFINILKYLRVGRCPPNTAERLQATANNFVDKNGITATRLCTHTNDVNHLNQSKLDALAGVVHVFKAEDSDSSFALKHDIGSAAPSQLQLKIGAQVMLTKNLDVNRSLVNGARGIVVGFSDVEGLPEVLFLGGEKRVLRRERWTVRLGDGGTLVRHQIPLRLAWAFSVHKSQGLTLDCVEVSLSRVFEAGQSYVALSRARNLKSLRLLDFDPEQVWADPEVLKFYKQLRRAESS